ncbi:MAG TPA: hypothetical protein VFG69_09185, partial [Nannocystaceae bacterium]|nr:hypothetical protein [Nannocystaceae bacterium]
TSGAGVTGNDDGPICDEGKALCDGECKDIAKDKHACGVDCIDCTVRFGNHATCEDGVCEPDEGKGG